MTIKITRRVLHPAALTTPVEICNASVVTVGDFALVFIDICNSNREESSWIYHPRGLKIVSLLFGTASSPNLREATLKVEYRGTNQVIRTYGAEADRGSFDPGQSQEVVVRYHVWYKREDMPR